MISVRSQAAMWGRCKEVGPVEGFRCGANRPRSTGGASFPMLLAISIMSMSFAVHRSRIPNGAMLVELYSLWTCLNCELHLICSSGRATCLRL